MPNNGTKNLVKNEDLTPEERRRRASNAGKASVKARRAKKEFKDALSRLLDYKPSEEQLEALHSAFPGVGKLTAREAIAMAQMVRAMNGDTQAAAWVRDTVGEKPGEKVTVDQDAPFEVNIKVIE